MKKNCHCHHSRYHFTGLPQTIFFLDRGSKPGASRHKHYLLWGHPGLRDWRCWKYCLKYIGIEIGRILFSPWQSLRYPAKTWKYRPCQKPVICLTYSWSRFQAHLVLPFIQPQIHEVFTWQNGIWNFAIFLPKYQVTTGKNGEINERKNGNNCLNLCTFT